ncbi:hypothetical protein GHK68_24425 [Sinorhizobium meliloti]|uniref:hypothetical protein n=1 Tax=Rhizobium meliloti TaxID=382 RepID=UPI0012981A17|nr:hypothetical protein [Sinorhizobium meliloti]MQW45320.1 hypothetical protein [Sinorhizobium meliloti]
MNKFLLAASAAVVAGMIAAPAYGAGGNNFSSIGSNIIASIRDVPGLISGLAYLFGLVLGVAGILKIKDHVENPQQTPLKDAAARLLAGGALFALPIVYEAMHNTIGQGGGVPVNGATLAAVSFGGGNGGGGGGRFGGCTWIFC